MREKITTFILFLIMLVLISVIILMIWAMYNGLDVEDIVETIQTNSISIVFDTELKDASTSNVSSSVSSNALVNTNTTTTNTQEDEGNDINDFYYSQLSDVQKTLYDGFKENKENMKSGTYTIEYGDAFSDILEEEDGFDILGDDYQSAIDAYVHDNPDLFYLDVSKLYLNVETTTKVFSTTYNVYVGTKNGESYLKDIFSSAADVNSAITKIEKVKNHILANLTDDDYDNIKLIHDYLINNIEYDQNYESIDSYSIYGALVDGKAVCEGYAKSFKYLANAAGIECELVQGTATNSEGATESHAWNCVYLEGKWYFIDATWDDPVIVGSGSILSNYKYKYFLKGTNTFSEDHVVETQFVENGKEFSIPTISTRDY